VPPQDAIRGTQKRRESNVNEVDVRERERQVGVQKNAFVEQVINHVKDRRLVLINDR
jgi:hypothetical protein